MNFLDRLKTFFAKVKFAVKGNKLSYRTITITTVMVGLALFIGANLLVSKFDVKVDLTSDKSNSISDKSKEYLKTVKKPITIIAFYGSKPKRLGNILDDYQKNCPVLKVEYVDASKNPVTAKRYQQGSREVIEGTLVFEGEKKYKMLDLSRFSESEINSTLSASAVEQEITGAINYIDQGLDTYAYFLEGEGEIPVDTLGSIKMYLSDINFVAKSINFLSASAVPSDAAVVAILAPQRDLSAEAAKKLKAYLEKGGNVLVTLEPSNAKFPNLYALLADYNIKPNDDLVEERDKTKVVFNDPLSFIPSLQPSDITNQVIAQNLNTVFMNTTSFSVIDTGNTEVSVEPLAKTSDNSFGEKNNDGKAVKDKDSQIEGPLLIGAAISKKQGTGDNAVKSKMVVFGDSHFLTDLFIKKLGAYGNADLLANSIMWLGERKGAVIIEQRSAEEQRFSLTMTQATTLTIIAALLPIIAIAFGTVVWFRRRHL